MIFKDSNATKGRPKLISHDKTNIPATSPSRSLSSLEKEIGKDRVIKVEISDNGYLIIDFSSVIGNKVKINQTHAKKLASWINSVYLKREETKKNARTKSRIS